MIRINLLPFRAARKKENVRRQISVFLLSLLLIAVCIIAVNMVFSSRITRLETRLTEAKTELEKYQAINREIEEIKKNLAILQKRTEVINQLQAKRLEAVALLDLLTKVVVENRMWITSLNAGDPNVTLLGVAMDNKTIADFMTRLEGTRNYKSVVLKYSKQFQMGKLSLKNFEITCEKVAQLPSQAKAG
jgi:type IV pilus assembly protein PilN